MSNFHVPLNGSNHVSRERKQAFQDAINDNYVIDCVGEVKDKPQPNGKVTLEPKSPKEVSKKTMTKNVSSSGNGQHTSPDSTNSIEMGLNHSIAHQTRTMDIHQQYLDQQGEYAQLITAVLNQQGKVLENGPSAASQEIIETFQRSLDNFHQIREKSMEVHQQFLAQQADFSHSFVSVLEKQHLITTNGNGYVVETIQPKSGPIEYEEVEEIEFVPLETQDTSSNSEEIRPESGNQEPKITLAGTSHAISPEILSEALMRIVGDKTGYPPEMLELGMDLEADLGIDSIKRVEILGALEEEFPSLPQADTEVLAQTRTLAEIVDYLNSDNSPRLSQDPKVNEPVVQELDVQPTPTSKEPEVRESATEQAGLSVDNLTAVLLEIVAEKTGYPVEMLESDMDMEADLGIDSIKRVEILGAMEEQIPGLPPVEAEVLAELRTLGEIVAMMSSSQVNSESSSNREVESKKKVNKSSLTTTPIELVQLPKPDFLDFAVSSDRPILVTDDGSELTPLFVNSLIKRGWKVIIWSFPEVKITRQNKDISPEVIQVFPDDSTQASIQKELTEIRAAHGLVSGFIHLHPVPQKNGEFSEPDRGLVKGVFFLAGALKADLSDNPSSSRTFFLTVTRLDGQLGLNSSDVFQEAGGLTGVVKTLHWEWPNVYCKAIDLDPQLDHENQIDCVIQEMHDPDRKLVEIGIRNNERVTIDRVYQTIS